jgi:hypothetical protein
MTREWNDAGQSEMALLTTSVILRIGAEGGGISLIGGQEATGYWHFSVRSVDQTPTFLAGEDADEEIVRASDWVSGWEAALELLDRRCSYWTRLYPLDVHAQFQDAVLAAVLARGGAEVAGTWKERFRMKERLARRRSDKR